MERSRDFFPLALAVTGAGAALTLTSAMVPQISIGYLLRVDILLAGLLPYLIYGLGAWLRRDWLPVILGALLLAGDAWLRGSALFSSRAGDAAELYLWPVLATLGLVLAYWLVPRPGAGADADPGAVSHG